MNRTLESRPLSPLTAGDADFLAAFEAGRPPETGFRHRDHIRMAWIYLRCHGLDAGIDRIAEGLRRFAAGNGAAAIYHVTLTRLWARLVGAAIRRDPGIDHFDRFLEKNPGLLDKDTPYAFYRRETLAKDAARAAWVEPDRLPLP